LSNQAAFKAPQLNCGAFFMLAPQSVNGVCATLPLRVVGGDEANAGACGMLAA